VCVQNHGAVPSKLRQPVCAYGRSGRREVTRPMALAGSEGGLGVTRSAAKYTAARHKECPDTQFLVNKRPTPELPYDKLVALSRQQNNLRATTGRHNHHVGPGSNRRSLRAVCGQYAATTNKTRQGLVQGSLEKNVPSGSVAFLSRSRAREHPAITHNLR
jgi:hypothetical protein